MTSDDDLVKLYESVTDQEMISDFNRLTSRMAELLDQITPALRQIVKDREEVSNLISVMKVRGVIPG